MPSPASHVIQQLGRDVTGIEPMTVLVFLVQRKRFGLVVTETGMLCRGRSTERERETSECESGRAGERTRRWKRSSITPPCP
jgi:hypothetical protein